MAHLVKRVINIDTSPVPLKNIGLTLAVGQVYEIPPREYGLWARHLDADVVPLLTAGKIKFNDGTIDLTNEESERYIETSERLDIQQGGNNKVRFAKIVNFLNNATVTDGGEGKANVTLDVFDTDEYNCPDTVSVGDFVYVSGDNTVDRAIANHQDKKFTIGAVKSKPTTTSAIVQFDGPLDGFIGLTAGLPVFLSTTTLGDVTQVPPIGNGKWLQLLGIAKNSTLIQLNIGIPIGRI